MASTLAGEVGLDGDGRLLDVGCGPGVLTLALAHYFAEALGIDPDADMLAEGERRAGQVGIPNARWVQARAEDIPALDLGTFKLVTFGQSFHWTDRERVAEAVYEILEPGGALALISHVHAGRPQPPGPGHPPIPHDTIRALVQYYLGPDLRAGQGVAPPPQEQHEYVLARTRFGSLQRIFCPGRPDIVQDIDGVLANYFSASFAAPHLFDDRLEHFAADVRAELTNYSPSGLFWDWPGDTEILLARKPG
ncbi:MAG TPA: class I SAM-dependent methyltransferase [Chloroflexia bacterium]|nr:class I SAM-dependent methyltransferase [Chloroflexia bacterium]